MLHADKKHTEGIPRVISKDKSVKLNDNGRRDIGTRGELFHSVSVNATGYFRRRDEFFCVQTDRQIHIKHADVIFKQLCTITDFNAMSLKLPFPGLGLGPTSNG